MLEMLSAEGDGAQRWRRLIEGLPLALRDIHFLPEYGRIFRAGYGHEPLLAYYQTDQGYVVQPFVRRALRGLAFLAADEDRGYADIANPYGYGGPLCSAADPRLARGLYAGFAAAFASWCDAQEIASEFASLHPFLERHQSALIADTLSVRHEKDIVFMDLGAAEADLVKALRKGHRSSASLARRSGVRVGKVASSPENLATFGEIYKATMVRRGAADRWFVPEGYFASCVRELGPARSSLFFATVRGEVESACLLMHDFGTAYYHYAASRSQHPELGVNNLLVLETALWAKAAGFARYHLGGGVTSSAGDTLLRFKSGFSRLSAPLYTYFCVRDRVVYDQLCERKKAHERSTAGRESSSDFLPLYRR